MWKVLGYDADSFGWTFVSSHKTATHAHVAAGSVKAQRLFQWVAVVLVTISVSTGETEISIVECDAPNFAALLNVAGFREAAAKR
jgi:hypothetical protein